ncbi:MAG: hypothetical protein II592_06685, partial [Muribaculaceae bacterium]|nr:hypothetical protein [Muribaculaceae bacterium]
MKVKALLFATAAVVAMTASAGTPPTTTKLYANDVTIVNAADKAIIKLILENPDQPDLSAFQIKIDAPEGFQFVQLSKKEAGIGSDQTLKDGFVRGIGLEFGLGLMANL